MSVTARDAIERYQSQVPRLKADFARRLAQIGDAKSPLYGRALEDEIRLRFDRATSSLLEALDAGWDPSEEELMRAFFDALNALDYRYSSFDDINSAGGYTPGKILGDFGDLIGQTMVASSNEAQARLKMHLKVLAKKAVGRGPAPSKRRAEKRGGLVPFRLTRVQLKNYKSIRHCSVPIQNVSVLVGPNGAGKSNFLDSIRFVNEALYDSLEFAIRERGGMAQLLRQEPGWESLAVTSDYDEKNCFEVALDFILPAGHTGIYRLAISESKNEFYVRSEDCFIESAGHDETPIGFTRHRNAVTSDIPFTSRPRDDRLFLAMIASIAPFDDVFEGLTNSMLYRFDLDEMRDAQPIDSGNFLADDGWNIASVVARLQTKHPRVKQRIEQYLRRILSHEAVLRARTSPPFVFFEFAQRLDDGRELLRLLASGISDGTLRATALLVALFQPNRNEDEAPIALVAFEEPETGIQPGALRVLFDAVMESSASRQVLFTTHSPELLDNPTISLDSILAVAFRDGATQIGKVDDTTLAIVRDGLATAGELLRNSDSLRPE
jgi:predicted ATPase